MRSSVSGSHRLCHFYGREADFVAVVEVGLTDRIKPFVSIVPLIVETNDFFLVSL